jgi:uncharacterized protein (TIGR04222 family)
MGNPFDLRGPEFLLFYTMLGAIVTMVVLAMRRRLEPQPMTAGPLTDYLKIAYLRGGPAEAIRVAALALMDRGLLELVDAHHLKATSADVPAGLQRTEERLLEACKEPVRASGLLADFTLQVAAATECEPQLVRAGLLPDESIKSKWAGLRTMAILLLGTVAALKVAIAVSRGRTNVAFLIILSALFVFVIYRVTSPFRTAAGNAMLDDLRTLFAALKMRAATLGWGAGRTGSEMALLAAVFGTGALPAGVPLDTVFRKPEQKSSGSCGSSSGSSCGSSGGSSCGGGGCGGGCGGCGS